MEKDKQILSNKLLYPYSLTNCKTWSYLDFLSIQRINIKTIVPFGVILKISYSLHYYFLPL